MKITPRNSNNGHKAHLCTSRTTNSGSSTAATAAVDLEGKVREEEQRTLQDNKVRKSIMNAAIFSMLLLRKREKVTRNLKA